jgi:ribonuclease E
MGSIRSVESMALAVLRLIGEEVRKDRTTRVVAQLPVDVSTFLINEKREWLHRLESAREIDIVLVPDPNMQTPNYSIRRVRDDEMTLPENAKTSYQMAGTGTVELDFQTQADKRPAAAPAAVQPIAPAAPAPTPAAPPATAEPSGPGFWASLLGLFRSNTEKEPAKEPASARREERPSGRHRRDHRDHREERGGRRPHRGDRERGPRHDRDRDRDRDRNRNRDRDRERDRPKDGQRPENPDRPRGGEGRDDAHHRPRERQPEAQRPPQAAQAPRQEPQSGEADPQRRRRRRRGRGGRGRQENYRPTDTQPITVPVQGGVDVAGQAPAPVAASPSPASDGFSQSPPVAPPPAPAPFESPGSDAPKSGSTYTVWSSSPGEGQHFDPKE